MITHNLAENAVVEASVYDVYGRCVRELYNGILSAGSHELMIDGVNLSSGIYLVQIRLNNTFHIQKIALMK